eukprot:4120620-Alexandrium_andersonii.AAC.1
MEHRRWARRQATAHRLPGHARAKATRPDKQRGQTRRRAWRGPICCAHVGRAPNPGSPTKHQCSAWDVAAPKGGLHLTTEGSTLRKGASG